MSEYDVLLGDDARAFLEAAGEKTTRICKAKLRYLAANPYPGQGRGNKENCLSTAAETVTGCVSPGRTQPSIRL